MRLPRRAVYLKIILTHFGIESDEHFSHHRHERDFFGLLPLLNEMLLELFHTGSMLNRTEDGHIEGTAYLDPALHEYGGCLASSHYRHSEAPRRLNDSFVYSLKVARNF